MYFEMCTSSEEWTCSWVPQGLVAHWNCLQYITASFAQIHEAGAACTNLADKYRELLISVEFLFGKKSSLVHVWGGRGEVPLSWHKLKWWLANQLEVQCSQLALQNFLSHQMCSCWGWLEPADPAPILACGWGHVMKFHVSIRDAKDIVLNSTSSHDGKIAFS